MNINHGLSGVSFPILVCILLKKKKTLKDSVSGMYSGSLPRVAGKGVFHFKPCALLCAMRLLAPCFIESCFEH